MENATKVLPLKEAYLFGDAHGLEREISEIRDKEIEWELSYNSSVRRGYIIDLFTKRQLLEAFKDQYWPTGKTVWGQRKIDFWLRLKARYDHFLAGRDETVLDSEETEEEQAFGAEADLRNTLANNLDCVETGLRLYNEGERTGIEFVIDDGRIDILAVDKAGRFVVFELKLTRGRNKTLGQLLYYMGWVDKHLGKAPCRGIIVAKEITDDLILATRRIEGVSLYRYKLSVTVERVS
jgi:hypothetical protein